MWKIKHIFDGDYGCEESDAPKMLSVTLINEILEEKVINIPDAWLIKRNLDVGSEWPDYSTFSIETKDLVLKKARHEDWKKMYENIWRHKESAQYMLWDVVTSEKEAVERTKRSVEFQNSNKYAFFIYEKKTGEPIGFAGMKEIEAGVYEDTGVALGPNFVGKGYGTQVLNALVQESKLAGADKFVASCRKQNIASHQLQMRCGFSFVKEEMRVDHRNGESYILEFNEKIIK